MELETRGLDLLEFFPFVDFEAKSAESKTVFREVDLSDEWYDVDETTLNEVSITDIKWSLIKL